ncbi:inosine-uridine preferring nucleoside hydrolase-like isoform X1 [Maniola jurtina]|uniref:inosine-uridine preferring nucleoside hydrolase-like isoform X1 n=1 Tax=Maniola jurtina TaxID=191418 RepID=UPI001E68C863|nr:inosine-uridine preferring nucleoside hydrolase-like isoform X1 [Maniola jurtina]
MLSLRSTVYLICKKISFYSPYNIRLSSAPAMQCQGDTSPKIIIDNDAGGDDAMAIFLALLYEKHFNGSKLIGLTTGNGNTNEDNVCRNNQRILKVAKRQDVPIYRGSKESMVITPAAGNYYGKDGLGDSGEVLSGLVEPKELDAVSALIELSKTHEGQLTVITLGALTNVAMALKLDPNFLNRLSQLYIGAGHIHDEEIPNPEFNAQMDVEAYHVVAQHATPDKVTVFPFSQTMRYLNFSLEWREQVLGAINTDIIKAQNLYEKVSLKRGDRWQALDPATVAIALKPELVDEYKYSKNDITLCGSKRGINTNEFVDKKDANVRIAYSVKTEEYRQFLLELFALE